jgi:hypothetical protein
MRSRQRSAVHDRPAGCELLRLFIFFFPGAAFLLIQILRDLPAYSRLGAYEITE